MPLVPCKCPSCGGALEVDNSKEAATCKYCAEAFIIEKAINNYNTTIINNYYKNASDNVSSENTTLLSDTLELDKLFEALDIMHNRGSRDDIRRINREFDNLFIKYPYDIDILEKYVSYGHKLDALPLIEKISRNPDSNKVKLALIYASIIPSLNEDNFNKNIYLFNQFKEYDAVIDSFAKRSYDRFSRMDGLTDFLHYYKDSKNSRVLDYQKKMLIDIIDVTDSKNGINNLKSLVPEGLKNDKEVEEAFHKKEAKNKKFKTLIIIGVSITIAILAIIIIVALIFVIAFFATIIAGLLKNINGNIIAFSNLLYNLIKRV